MRTTLGLYIMTAALALGTGAAHGEQYPEPLAPEPTMTVQTLPSPLPPDWVYVDMLAPQKVEILDTRAKSPTHVRGVIGAAYVANFQQSAVRPEIYVAETFFARGTRGARSDFLTIYDSRTLLPSGEIALPDSKRALMVIQPNAFQLIDHDKLALVYNFTPASSVTVVDLIARRVLGEVPLPGCALTYPTGARGFSTLCADGTLLSVQLDDAGKVASQVSTEPFNDLDKDALFSIPAVIGGTSYFVSFKGHVQPIDLSGATPRLLPSWSLVGAKEAKANWRPSGHQLAAGDTEGRLYVIMQPNGREGSHKGGGPEVWVFDTASHAKVRTIKLKGVNQSIAIGGMHPALLVMGTDATLDRYDLRTGKLQNSLPTNSKGAQTLLYPVHR